MLTCNLWQEVDLVTRANGEIMAIMCKRETPSPALPALCWLNLMVTPALLSIRSMWCVPTAPVEVQGVTQCHGAPGTCCQTSWSWAITMHRLQGHTIDKAVINPGHVRGHQD
ncbi:unnamed protein product [Discosporangium mesarthrocarpum]